MKGRSLVAKSIRMEDRDRCFTGGGDLEHHLGRQQVSLT